MLRIYDDAIAVLGMLRPTLDENGRRDTDLARQLRRCAASMVLNIAEGSYARRGNKPPCMASRAGRRGALPARVKWRRRDSFAPPPIAFNESSDRGRRQSSLEPLFDARIDRLDVAERIGDVEARPRLLRRAEGPPRTRPSFDCRPPPDPSAMFNAIDAAHRRSCRTKSPSCRPISTITGRSLPSTAIASS